MTLAVEVPASPPAPPPKPAAHEDRRLLLRYQRHGDLRARDELCERFLPLARQLARRYQRGSEPLDDLVQVASVGLVKAIDRFDEDRTTAFSSYAVPTMVGELKRYFRDFGWTVYVPRGMRERTVAVQATVTRLAKELGRSPAAAEVASELDLSEEHVLEAMEAALAYDALSLEAPRPGGDEAGGAVFGDTIGELDERDRRIPHMRFQEDLTQSEIAGRIGVSQMHVSRLIRRVLERLEATATEGDGVDEVAAAASAG